MITFVDTNILLDVFLPDPEFGDKSLAAIEKAFNEYYLMSLPMSLRRLIIE